MTQIRSAMVIASSWSWVMNRKVVRIVALQISFRNSCICAAQLGVERAQRLVEQNEPRLADDRPGQRHALPLAAGELGRDSAPPKSSRRTRRSACSTCARICAFGVRRTEQPVADILVHGHVREQRVVLEDRVERAAVDRPCAMSSGPSKRMSPPDGSMKPPISRSIVVLPDPRRPDDGQELAVAHREIDRAAPSTRGRCAVALLDADQLAGRSAERSPAPIGPPP